MNILVTGGFGFLGGHLLDLLLADPEATVVVVDNLSTSPLPLERLLDELGHPRRLQYCVSDVEDFCRRWSGPRFEEIYHLASVVGPAGVLPHAGRIAASILRDTLAIADVALGCNARLVDVSTSEVYGGGQQGFCSETMAKIVPAAASARVEYAVGKLAAETAVLNLCRTQGLKVRIVRPFNVSGPRQSGKGGFVLPRFIAQAMTGADVTVFGDGMQVRAFTHVRDLVAGIVSAMRAGRDGELYNLGNPANRCAIGDLAQEVIAVVGSHSRIVHIDPKTIYGPLYEEANDKFPDAARAMTELGWIPRYGRRATIVETYEYMKALPQELLEHVSGIPSPAPRYAAPARAARVAVAG